MKDILIIGAGPYDLALAALAESLMLDFELVGIPMSLWREHIPKVLFLRTGIDEHFDVEGFHTKERRLRLRWNRKLLLRNVDIVVCFGNRSGLFTSLKSGYVLPQGEG